MSTPVESGYTGPGHFVGAWAGKIGGTIGGNYVAGTPGGIVGHSAGEKLGANIGKGLDNYCVEEGKKIQAEYDAAIQSGMPRMEAAQYATFITGWD